MSQTIDAAQTASPVIKMTPRQVLEALSGLLLGMFVAILASTVVSTSLPRIISDLKGDQTAYTWVVTATLLATAVTTPMWGKLADLFNRKLLIQLALGIFVVGSALAGFSQDTNTLIAFRVVQGIGAGGLTALSQVIMADIISPRERGRYMGLFGGIMAVGTVGGPLIGGLLTDSLGWRWNFYVGVPFAIVAILLLQRTLHLPKKPHRKVSIDYLGAIFLAAGVSLLLVWVSLAGQKGQFAWDSATSFWMVGGAAALLIATVITEMKAKEPIIPLQLFTNRTFTFAVIASIAVGVAMFGTSVFLSQYMQLARGASPTQSGLLTLPMIIGLMGSSVIVGQLISRSGKWKTYMVTGSILLTAGLFLMSTISYDTNYVLLSVYMLVLGAGVGMVMQNLVLVVQNVVAPQQLGVASSSVTFFRSIGGTIGVSVMGSALGSKVVELLGDRSGDLQAAIVKLGAGGAKVAEALQSGTIPKVSALPTGVRTIIESVYGDAVAHVFLIAAPLAILTIIAIALIPNNRLGTQTALERMVEPEPGESAAVLEAESTLAEVSEAMVAGAPAASAADELRDSKETGRSSRL
ncbi:MDR family MFS transporter [Glaciihabitans sp. UYNi722]|uniref:MDR family MFS transporter n=1 Tax=Glaciihabitans sp. UYNi722 TaxID=3156344 RepID=UPI0033983E6E